MFLEKHKIECEPEQRDLAIAAAKEAIKMYESNQERASHVRRTMDDQFGLAWSCIVGTDFGR